MVQIRPVLLGWQWRKATPEGWTRWRFRLGSRRMVLVYLVFLFGPDVVLVEGFRL